MCLWPSARTLLRGVTKWLVGSPRTPDNQRPGHQGPRRAEQPPFPALLRAEGYQQRRHRFRLPSPNQDYRGPEGVVGVFKELDEHRLQPRAFRTAWASGGTPTRATLRERGAATPQQPAAPGNRASNTLTMTTYPL